LADCALLYFEKLSANYIASINQQISTLTSSSLRWREKTWGGLSDQDFRYMDKSIASNLEGLSAAEQRALLQKLLQEKKANQQSKTAVLSFGQERLWFLHQLDSANAAYNLRTAVRLQGHLDIPALEASLQQVVDRHESLRTKIVADNGRAQQQIQSAMPLPLPITDLTGLTGAAQETAVQQHSDAEAQAPFDLANGPLFRARLLKRQPDDHILLLTMHHIISDGWSIGILIREIATLYQTRVAHLPARCPTCPCSTPTLPPGSVNGCKVKRWKSSWKLLAGAAGGYGRHRPTHRSSTSYRADLFRGTPLLHHLANHCQPVPTAELRRKQHAVHGPAGGI
jgi:hypothetical protein